MHTESARLAVTRESILNLLTATEMANVSRDEGQLWLVRGDHFLDLAHLEAGVQKVQILRRDPATAIAKASVSVATWGKIVAALAATGPAGASA